MARWLGIIATIIAGVIVLSGIYIAFAVNRPATAEAVTRTANPKIVWGEQAVVVSVAIDATSLPNCNAVNPGADIVLLVDRSDSMAGQPFADALDAVRVFLDSVDFTDNKVAILFFNDSVEGQSLTTNRTLFNNSLSSQTTSGGTAMDMALNAAATEFASAARRPNANPIVILVSDGAANDVVTTDTAATNLKAQNVRIVTVALGNEVTAHQYLATVASSVSDAYISPSSSDLALIYRSIAEGINSSVATNVQISERINTDAFELVPTSPLPPALVSGDSITWVVPNLPVTGGVYRYRVIPQSLGLLTINTQGGQASLRDCQGNLPVYNLPPGPEILVAPGWLLPILVLFPFLLLAFGLLAWWRNRPTPQRPTPTPAFEPPPVGPMDETPVWLTMLTTSKILPLSATEREVSELQRTVMIGCGPAGRTVLSQVAQTLRARFGGELPNTVRLLQIDVYVGKGEKPPLPVGLDENQRVLLEPNLQEVEKNLRNAPKEWSHWQWYDEAQGERGKGRMAFFYDVKDGEQNSQLWRALKTTFNDLPTPKVRVIGTTFDDVGSAMLVDVAYLTQVVTKQQASDIELWLAGPLSQSWSERLDQPRQKLDEDEQRTRTLATLREIERFQRNVPMSYVYAPASTRQAELRELRRPGVVESLFIFEPQYPKTAPEGDTFAAMSESLLALLHPAVNQAVIQQTQANRLTAGQRRNDEGIGMTYAIGCYSVRLPAQVLSPLLGWRYLHDLMFDQYTGLYPLETLREDGTYYRLLDTEQEDLVDYTKLKERAIKFADTIAGTNGPGFESLGFRGQLRKQLSGALNGDDEPWGDPLGHVNGLRRARLWLTALRGELVRRGGRAATEQVNTLISELEGWEQWLTDSLRPMIAQAIDRHRHDLKLLQQEPARDWMIDTRLEMPYYRDVVPVREADTPVRDDEMLIQAGTRFGWELRSKSDGKGYTLRLLVPSPDYVSQSATARFDTFAFDRNTDPAACLAALYLIATRYTRPRRDVSLLIARASERNATAWDQATTLRTSYNQAATTTLMRQSGQSTIMIGPSGPQLQPLVDTLGENRAGKWLAVASADTTCVTLLRVTDAIPLIMIELYDSERWHDTPPAPQHYVWYPEQIAATHEKSDRFSTLFTSWLAADEEVLSLFARSYLYDVITQDDEAHWEIPGIGRVPGVRLATTLDTLIYRTTELQERRRRENALVPWRAAVERKEHEIAPQRMAFLQEARRTKLKTLASSADMIERDFGQYLTSMIG